MLGSLEPPREEERKIGSGTASVSRLRLSLRRASLQASTVELADTPHVLLRAGR
jgi:hypothetical protein